MVNVSRLFHWVMFLCLLYEWGELNKSYRFNILTGRVELRCESHEFTCGLEKCIPGRLVCDDTKHCKDGSDEISCDGKEPSPATGCEPNQFVCMELIEGSPQCIPRKWVCNCEADCTDGSDEHYCPNECPPVETKPDISPGDVIPPPL